MKRSFYLILLAVVVANSSYASNAALRLAQEKNCLTCHNGNNKILGPAYRLVAAKYTGDPAAEDRLVAKIKAGGGGVWGRYKMPANDLTDDEAHTLVKWVLSQKQ